MSEQNDLSPKSDAAIQVKVCGQDVQGQRFDETSTAFPTSRGVMLETVHRLREESTLELTHILTNRKAVAQVKSMGPRLGVSTLVFLEGTDVANFWIKGNAKESDKSRKDDGAGDSHRVTAANTDTLVLLPERALTHVSKLRIPTMDRFMDTFSELVESALEENLRPTVEQLTNEIQQKVVKTQSEVLANFEQKIQAVSSTLSDRWDVRVVDVVARNEKVLTKTIRELMDETQLFVKNQQNELNENLEAALQSGRERMNQQVDGIVAEVSARSQERIREEFSRFEKQFAERWQAAAVEGQNTVSDRARQVEADLAERLSGKINATLDGFSVELEKRFEQALARHASVMEERQQSFLDNMENELSHKQELFGYQAQRLMERVADQNRTRIALSLRELAEAMENEAPPIPATAALAG
jgi:hypothetical protein